MKTLYDWSEIPEKYSAGTTDGCGGTFFWEHVHGKPIERSDLVIHDGKWQVASHCGRDIECCDIEMITSRVPWRESFEQRPVEVGNEAERSGLTLVGGTAVTEPDGTRHGFCDPREVLGFIRGYQARKAFTARAANLSAAPDHFTHGAGDYGPSYDLTEGGQ